jgi:hypothetical protein
MSKGNLTKRPAFADAAWLLVALTLCCLIVGIVAFSGGRQAEQQSRADHQQRPQQADTDRAGVPAFAERLISNPEPPEGTEREKRDLAAQENTATWAFWIVLLTAAQVVLSGFGLVALLQSLQQARDGLQKAADANQIARDAQRAWVTLNVEPQLVRRDGNGVYFRNDVIAGNVGGTIATHYAVRNEIMFQRDDDSRESFLAKIQGIVDSWRLATKAPSNQILAPGEHEVGQYWCSKMPPELIRKNVMPGYDVTYPTLLFAVFYRTVNEPDLLQVSWRTWLIGSVEMDGDPISMLRIQDTRKECLHVMPMTSMRHEVHSVV